jgi:hypothetical protein
MLWTKYSQTCPCENFSHALLRTVYYANVLVSWQNSHIYIDYNFLPRWQIYRTVLLSIHSRTQSPSYARSTERDEGLWPNPYQTGIWLATTKVIVLITYISFTMFLWFPVLDLARAPRRTARKKGSGYENVIHPDNKDLSSLVPVVLKQVREKTWTGT